jgi:hypothetical protein
MTVELRVWTNGNEWVIAPDVAVAAHQWHLQIGDDPEDYDFTWTALEPTEPLTIWCDDDGTPGEVDGDGCDRVTLTAAEWVAKIGLGYLASSEI